MSPQGSCGPGLGPFATPALLESGRSFSGASTGAPLPRRVRSTLRILFLFDPDEKERTEK